jgi:hypothetical protein
MERREVIDHRIENGKTSLSTLTIINISSFICSLVLPFGRSAYNSIPCKRCELVLYKRNLKLGVGDKYLKSRDGK